MSERRLHHADTAAFRHAMRAFASGVAIVACGDGDRRIGCTVTSLASLSLTPPTLFICLTRASSTLTALREAGAFSVNLLAARDEALAHRFSGRGGMHGPRRFDGARWTALATGAPVLVGALAAFDCLLEEVIERHSHAIVLGAVVSLHEGVDEPALGHWRGDYAPLR
jgi:flavin reductase (DIM6/NTAB) family NADH-FMN oxidoreductase RutF